MVAVDANLFLLVAAKNPANQLPTVAGSRGMAWLEGNCCLLGEARAEQHDTTTTRPNADPGSRRQGSRRNSMFCVASANIAQPRPATKTEGLEVHVLRVTVRGRKM